MHLSSPVYTRHAESQDITYRQALSMVGYICSLWALGTFCVELYLTLELKGSWHLLPVLGHANSRDVGLSLSETPCNKEV